MTSRDSSHAGVPHGTSRNSSRQGIPLHATPSMPLTTSRGGHGVLVTDVENLAAVDASAREEDFSTLADVLAAGLRPSGEHEVEEYEDEDMIQWTCRRCGRRGLGVHPMSTPDERQWWRETMRRGREYWQRMLDEGREILSLLNDATAEVAPTPTDDLNGAPGGRSASESGTSAGGEFGSSIQPMPSPYASGSREVQRGLRDGEA